VLACGTASLRVQTQVAPNWCKRGYNKGEPASKTMSRERETETERDELHTDPRAHGSVVIIAWNATGLRGESHIQHFANPLLCQVNATSPSKQVGREDVRFVASPIYNTHYHRHHQHIDRHPWTSTTHTTWHRHSTYNRDWAKRYAGIGQ
jgi:predicted DNA-binding WGR domain protein